MNLDGVPTVATRKKYAKAGEAVIKTMTKTKNNRAAFLLARKIGQLRESKGLTLRDVASSTGISNAYLSQLETGKVENPGVFTLLRLTEFYGVKLEWLVSR